MKSKTQVLGTTLPDHFSQTLHPDPHFNERILNKTKLYINTSE